MKCHICGSEKAVLHIKEIIAGEQYELNVCKECEANNKIVEKCLELECENLSYNNNIDNYKLVNINKAEKEPKYNKTCDYCGYSLSEFLETSTLSCPRCYEVFKTYINKNLRKIHKSSKHLGKIANKKVTTKDIEAEIAKYNDTIDLLVKEENYEEALLIKNKLNEFKKSLIDKKNNK